MNKKTKTIIAMIVLVGVCFANPFGSQPSQAKGKNYAEPYSTLLYHPDDINEELAKEFEKSIRTEKDLGICLPQKDGSITKLRKLVSQANGYGVLFHYKYEGKGVDGRFYYRITDLSLYSDTLKLLKKIRKQYLAFYDGIKNRNKFKEPDDVETNDKYSFYRLVRDSRFCDLSSAAKVKVIAESAFWCDYKTAKKNPFIHFNKKAYETGNDQGCNDYGTNSELIHRMITGKAKTVENGYVSFETALYKQLGIVPYVVTSKKNSVNLINTENSAGKTLWIYQYCDRLIDWSGSIRTLDKKIHKASEFEMNEDILLDWDDGDNRWSLQDIV